MVLTFSNKIKIRRFHQFDSHKFIFKLAVIEIANIKKKFMIDFYLFLSGIKF